MCGCLQPASNLMTGIYEPGAYPVQINTPTTRPSLADIQSLMQSGVLPFSIPGFGGMHGLGDVCYDADGNGYDCGGSTSQVPTETPYPVIMSSPTVSSAPLTANPLTALLNSWSTTAQQILKAQSGAQPTLIQTNPNGASTTYYGAASTLPTSLTASSLLTGISGSTLLILGVGIVALMAMRKH